MAIIIKKKVKGKKPDSKPKRVFRVMKRLDDGSFLIAGRVVRKKRAYAGYFGDR